MQRQYIEAAKGDDFLWVREASDEQLLRWMELAGDIYHAILMEVAFRSEHPEYQDGTSNIVGEDVRLYEIADHIREELPVRSNVNVEDRE